MTIDFSNEKLERIANDILFLDKFVRKEKAHCVTRSEERRVEKQSRSRWSPYH